MYASSSACPLDALPSLSALQSWVHRPQAVAPCFVSDVYALQALREDTGAISRITRDVFLLNNFPCKFVELVGWVAGVDHKDASLTIHRARLSSSILTTVDDGDGTHVLQVVVRLAEMETPQTPKKNKIEKRDTFRSASERTSARAAAPPALSKNPFGPPTKLYSRPDVRVGDTVRVVGRVDEWSRRTDSVRQVIVDEASASGLLRVVDPDEQYRHVSTVVDLHREVYSQPFSMPTPAPSVKSSPVKSVASTMDLTALSNLSSELDYVEDDDFGPDLPDPAKLSSSQLTEDTFKRYVMDYMVRETKRAMKPATACLFGDATAQVQPLALLFAEYAASTKPPPAPPPRRPSPPPQPMFTPPTPKPKVFAPSHAENESTPKPRTFRSKAEREAAKRPKVEESPTRTSRSPCPPVVESSMKATPRATLPMDDSCVGSSFEGFTVSNLLDVDHLHALATRVVDAKVRREENMRRKRLKSGTSTERDARVVAARKAQGLKSSDYKLSEEERFGKMVRLTNWAIRAAAGEGALVQVDGDRGMHSLRTMGSFDASASTLLLGSADAYVPLPPELLGPLLLPLATAERARRKATFRSRAERDRRTHVDSHTLSVPLLVSRLRAWGEAGRWERVGEWAVEAAAEWAEACGLLSMQ